MSVLRYKKFHRLLRLSYTSKNITKLIKTKSRKKIESNLYVLKRPFTAYYGINRYKEFKQLIRAPSLLANLETRADVVLYRLHWAKSIFEARDMIRKGFLWVNACIISNPYQLLPLKTVFSLFIYRRNSVINILSLILINNLQKSFLNRIRKRKQRFFKFHQLNTLSVLKARPYQQLFWNHWIYCPPHLFVDQGLQIATILYWPTYPYKYLPYKNLESLGQYLNQGH